MRFTAKFAVLGCALLGSQMALASPLSYDDNHSVSARHEALLALRAPVDPSSIMFLEPRGGGGLLISSSSHHHDMTGWQTAFVVGQVFGQILMVLVATFFALAGKEGYEMYCKDLRRKSDYQCETWGFIVGLLVWVAIEGPVQAAFGYGDTKFGSMRKRGGVGDDQQLMQQSASAFEKVFSAGGGGSVRAQGGDLVVDGAQLAGVDSRFNARMSRTDWGFQNKVTVGGLDPMYINVFMNLEDMDPKTVEEESKLRNQPNAARDFANQFPRYFNALYDEDLGLPTGFIGGKLSPIGGAPVSFSLTSAPDAMAVDDMPRSQHSRVNTIVED